MDFPNLICLSTFLLPSGSNVFLILSNTFSKILS